MNMSVLLFVFLCMHTGYVTSTVYIHTVYIHVRCTYGNIIITKLIMLDHVQCLTVLENS